MIQKHLLQYSDLQDTYLTHSDMHEYISNIRCLKIPKFREQNPEFRNILPDLVYSFHPYYQQERAQYSKALKNVSPKNGQAGVSRFFKNIPGWKVEDQNKFGRT